MVRYGLVGCLALLGGCANDAGPVAARGGPANACFWPSQVSGFADNGPDKVVVRLGTQERWELTLAPGCPDVDYALNIGIRSRGGQAICPGRPAELVIPEVSGTGSRTCLVRSVRRLTAAEAAALTDAS